MIFTSFNFLIFFPIVILLFFLLPSKFRWSYLLIVSYYFYINLNPTYAILLGGVTLTTYTFAKYIDKAKSDRNRKYLLIVYIILAILPLFFFKYYNFVNEGIIRLLQYSGIRWPLPEFSLLLPIGISFYTFMALGYVIDVYNEEIKAEKNFGIVALFLSFFPLVLSGPIERASNMLPQYHSKLEFNYGMAVKGLQLMLWGYFMKLVIAERIAIYTGAVFSNAEFHSGTSLLLATLLYPIQVYGDLGGYSLIAIGCANVMGIKIIPNFNRPFFSTSMSDFWRRWHMSLIKWLTDYIYTPLSFSLRKYRITGIVVALMLTFIISGIWHGAALTFILWGALQGIVLSFEAITNKRKQSFEEKHKLKGSRAYILLSCVLTYLLFSFSLLFGGVAGSVSNCFFVIGRIFTNFQPLFLEKSTLFYIAIGTTLLLLSEFRDEYFSKKFLLFENRHRIIRWSAYTFTLVLLILIGVFDGGQFIYFQF